jgi:hypothetical protein
MRLPLLVRPHNTVALFVIMAVIGTCTIIMLPATLEIACEITRNAGGSSALLWFGYVIKSFSTIVILTLSK